MTADQTLPEVQGTDSADADVVVIGGGQAGLAVAWHLQQQGIRPLVLEAGEQVGHTWRSRWTSLTLFTPAEYDGLPGRPFPAPAGSYPGKDAVADYLRDYAPEEKGAAASALAIDAVVQAARTGATLPPDD